MARQISLLYTSQRGIGYSLKDLLQYALFHSRFFLIPTNGRKTQEQFSILHCALGKNADWLDLGTFEVIKTQNPKHGVIL